MWYQATARENAASERRASLRQSNRLRQSLTSRGFELRPLHAGSPLNRSPPPLLHQWARLGSKPEQNVRRSDAAPSKGWRVWTPSRGPAHGGLPRLALQARGMESLLTFQFRARLAGRLSCSVSGSDWRDRYHRAPLPFYCCAKLFIVPSPTVGMSCSLCGMWVATARAGPPPRFYGRLLGLDPKQHTPHLALYLARMCRSPVSGLALRHWSNWFCRLARVQSNHDAFYSPHIGSERLRTPRELLRPQRHDVLGTRFKSAQTPVVVKAGKSASVGGGQLCARAKAAGR